MFQFTLDPRGDDRDFLPLGPDELAERLLELHEIVVKLGNARWPVGTNAIGIRFRAPDDCAGGCAGGDVGPDVAGVDVAAGRGGIACDRR